MSTDDQQFCLRWNNHQSTLISVFDTLLESGTLVDCTLAAEGQYLKAHKVVLSACSPYLEVLLSQHTDLHPILILRDVTFVELKAMMDYMYRGEVNISQDQLGTFLKSAESLQIKGLTDSSETGDGRDVGSTVSKRQEPLPRKVPPAVPPLPQSRNQNLPISSGLSIEQRRSSAQLTESPRDGSISPSLRKRRRIRRTSNGEDSNITNDTSNSCDLPPQAQSTPVVPNAPVTMPSPIVPPTVNPKTEIQSFNRLDSANFNSVPPESGLLKEKIEPPSEPLLEPKTEYLDYLNNDNSVEDLTLDDDDDMDMSQPGPSHGGDPSQGFGQWHMSGDQSGAGDEVFMAAQEAVNAQQRDSQGKRSVMRKIGLQYANPTDEDLPVSPSAADFSATKLDPNATSNKCNKCGKSYKYQDGLRKHKKLYCGREPQFFCLMCPKRFYQKIHVRCHMFSVHGTPTV